MSEPDDSTSENSGRGRLLLDGLNEDQADFLHGLLSASALGRPPAALLADWRASVSAYVQCSVEDAFLLLSEVGDEEKWIEEGWAAELPAHLRRLVVTHASAVHGIIDHIVRPRDWIRVNTEEYERRSIGESWVNLSIDRVDGQSLTLELSAQSLGRLVRSLSRQLAKLSDEAVSSLSGEALKVAVGHLEDVRRRREEMRSADDSSASSGEA